MPLDHFDDEIDAWALRDPALQRFPTLPEPLPAREPERRQPSNRDWAVMEIDPQWQPAPLISFDSFIALQRLH